MQELKSPFINDPSAIVALAFSSLYPETKYTAQMVEKLEDENGQEVYGCTYFDEDHKEIPLIEVSGQTPASAVPEIFAHELAHIVTNDGHGQSWDQVFEDILNKYTELCEELLGEGGRSND